MKRIAICLVIGLCAFGTACVDGAVITPGNIVYPGVAGETFSFDYLISDPMGGSIRSFQATISVSGLGGSTIDTVKSEAVAVDPAYWCNGNSGGAALATNGGDQPYQFGDYVADSSVVDLATDQIMSRYAFQWDGLPGLYEFTIDLDPGKSFIMESDFTKTAVSFTPGQYLSEGDGSFSVYVPEPSSFCLLIWAGLGLLGKRKS